MAISILGDPLVPGPLSPITNTSYGLHPPLASPASPPLGGLPQPYMQLAGQQPFLQPSVHRPHPQQYAQAPAAAAAAAAAQQPGLGAAVLPLGAPPTREESAAALAAEIGVDVVTAQRIQELSLQKQQVGWRKAVREGGRCGLSGWPAHGCAALASQCGNLC